MRKNMKIVNLTILIVIILIIPSTFLFSQDGKTETLKKTKERAFNAVKTNDIALLTDLIKNKDILDSVDGRGWSLLHLVQDSGKRKPFSKMTLCCKRITFLTDDIAFYISLTRN
jgi:hypothetical protein